MTVVGDFAEGETISEIAQTIGSLPERHQAESLTVQRFVNFSLSAAALGI